MASDRPISPGISWYETTVGERPSFPRLDGSRKADVAIVGGGFTGLSAAVHLARAGADVVLIEADRIANGASGRNGGQLGTGQRQWPEEMEPELGVERSKALFDLAEEAKAHLLDFAKDNGIEIDYAPGQMSVAHKKRFLDEYRAHADIMAERYGYPHIRYMESGETERRLGSRRYFGGVYDNGTGHINPLKLAVGTARIAEKSGARIFENTEAVSVNSRNGIVTVETSSGTITARNCLLALNAYRGGLEKESSSHVMPIGSFIGATSPLGDDSDVLPGGESVDDSRFVIRYFRRSKDGRLLFGGREIYSTDNPEGIKQAIKRQITDVYPQLRDTPITHAWGGYVGITVPRKPFIREVMPHVIYAGGFSGHGVMLSNFTGRLYAEALAGDRSRMKLLEDLKVPAFPGGDRFRDPLLFLALNWFALRDRL
jgi:gamma-glutamylputrescine oxidase